MNSKLRWLVTLAGMLVLGVMAVCLTPSQQPKVITTQTTVVITQNIDADGHYWTQVHLPKDGELRINISKESYEKEIEGEYYVDKRLLRKTKLQNYTFYSRVCCGQTRPELYVYTPTWLDYASNTQLVYFGADQILVIDLPKEIVKPQIGELHANAIRYSLAIKY